jgi:predicted nucleic acid-binding protein
MILAEYPAGRKNTASPSSISCRQEMGLRGSAADVQQAWASYQSVPVRLAPIAAGRAVNLALESGLYADDGYVLETALAEGLALLTLDIGLARAAQKVGVKLQEF